MAHTVKPPLRRSFSEHVKSSTNKAWDVFWKNVREKRLSEIEAREVCDWLRAAGFPQYAQLFKDCKFPIDIDGVKRDHAFLDKDAIDSLCRRLTTLNKCVDMKLEVKRSRRRSEDSEEDEPCAISSKWSYERQSMQWSRLKELEPFEVPNSALKGTGNEEVGDKHEASSAHSSCSSDSDGHGPSWGVSEVGGGHSSSSLKLPTMDSSFSGPSSPSELPSYGNKECFPEKLPWKRGTGLLKRMEKLRINSTTLRTRSRLRDKPTIGSPVLLEGFDESKLRHLHCVDIMELPHKLESQLSSVDTSGSSANSSSSGNCSSSPSESNSAVSTPSPVTKVRSHYRRDGLPKLDSARNRDHATEQERENRKNKHENLVFQIPQEHKPGTFPMALDHNEDHSSVNWRTGSFHGYRGRQGLSSLSSEKACSPLAVHDQRTSIYDNVPSMLDHTRSMEEEEEETDEDDVFSALDNVMERINGLQQLVSTWTEKFSDEGDLDSANDSASPSPSPPKDIHLEIKKHKAEDPDGSEGHMENFDKQVDDFQSQCADLAFKQKSLQHKRCLHWSSEQSLHPEPLGVGIESLFAPQMNLLQKLSLLRLTALMDKYSPTSKQGWNWTVPKFIRKSKAVDNKDRRVFGVPLLVSAQHSGGPLPRSILKAMQYLRTQCLDQVGLFRKSGVKSRIQFLRDLIEADPDVGSFEGHSAYDVADMVKQYFRDLPESIFSNKLCESFLHIYQYFPKDQQLAATQAAIFLLPDENREALRTLLFLLKDVVDCVEENQMTPTNIAVCLAPSILHLNTLRRDGSTSSKLSQRKHSLGRPDQRDLTENLAATQGLAHMVSEAHRLFQVPKYWVTYSQGRLNEEVLQMDQGLNFPVCTSEAEVDDRTRLDLSIQNILKESRERFRGWVPCSTIDHVDLSFKKVEDGYPLRLWRAVVEVEAPPKEVLNCVLRQHGLWKRDLRTCRVVEVRETNTEVYHYSLEGVGPQPPQEHLLLRTWQRDPTSDAFVISAVSTEHPDVPQNGMRAQVLTCAYLLEPLGMRTQLTHICRTDTRGHTPEWYNKVWGHLLASELGAIRDTFSVDAIATKA